MFPGWGYLRCVALRSLLKREDHSKIKFRQQHEETYTALWRSLLMIGKIDEALLFAAEQGLAQTLQLIGDNVKIEFEVFDDVKK